MEINPIPETLPRAKRGSNFEYDATYYGKIGEDDLISRLQISDKSVEIINVGKNENFYDYDIDIIQMTEPGYTVDNVLEYLRMNSVQKIPFAHTYEVKTDTVSIDTRNIVYEILSHDNPGCLAKSKAEFVYYVFLDREDKIAERYILNLREWRRWIREHSNDCNKSSFLKTHNFNRTNDKCFNFLCNIEKLVEDKVAKKLD